jgi:SagB-type dehydrogenase family enzyme
MNDGAYEPYRAFLKDHIRQEVDFRRTDQNRRLPPPPLQKPFEPGSPLLELPDGALALEQRCSQPLGDLILSRESRRSFLSDPFSLEELSALLFAVQGVRRTLSAAVALRTVPSAGARHPFETYIAVHNVDSLERGLYRYLPFEGKLLFLYPDPDIGERAAAACLDQRFVASAAATFFWTAIPARTEWRYGTASHKVIALDAGHLCQNLYLACESIDAGVCAIAAYDQDECDRLLGVDGVEEFTVYCAAAGKVG